ncbi:MAG: twin arginine-targeting protein translocase TatC [Candidatus Muproteobacteria bacterium RBG_16_60_9]|uniref:Sec-independent protein translocase protein TatC n=1 Tax=Candidatus Muproteobacteria bacterium RBG_16_60_9 TaxID=1817755 RepID=A0A1F6VHR6_9PROT|nr:MAG: twin arginine-targeting protein translocase TatC [Candidatus Muproteobacteria bacterium RBG_16_60_9]
MTEPDKSTERGGSEGSFISHLLELRNRVLYALIAVGVVFIGLVPFANQVYALLAKPLLGVLPQGASMIATDVASPFLTPIRLTLAVALVIAIPVVLYQVWAFVAPGLYRHEKRVAIPLLFSSIFLFYAGMAFAYFIVFPVAFGFFAQSAPEGVLMMTDIKAYLDFVFSMFFAFGIAFEIPVAVVILSVMGIVDPEALAGKRSYVIVGAFVLAAVLTPPDVFSQILLAVPTILLFEVGLFFARRWKASVNATDAADKPPAAASDGDK